GVGLDADEDARRARRQSVAVLALRLRVFGVANDAHLRAVHLPARGERPASFEQREEAASVLAYVLRRVLVEAREVQRVFGERADAARACREGVGEAVPFERRADNRAHALDTFAPLESGAFHFSLSRDHL